MAEVVPELDDSIFSDDKPETSAWEKFQIQKDVMDQALARMGALSGVMGYQDGSKSIDDLLSGDEDDDNDDLFLIPVLKNSMERSFACGAPAPLSGIMDIIISNTDIIYNNTDGDEMKTIQLRERFGFIFKHLFDSYTDIIPVPKIDINDEGLILSDVLFYRKEDL